MVDTMLYKADSRNIGKADFEVSDKAVTIFNVPLTGEIVQPYSDGVAYKPAEEILAVDVKNTPISFLHPSKLVDNMPTEQAADNTYGMLKKPSLKRKKSKISKDKLYSDMIIFRNDAKVDMLINKLERGEGVDVSIGFRYKQDNTPGSFDGQNYDYIQRNIELDHLAILMDDQGFIHQGRASFQAGYGIGNDSRDEKMSNEKIVQDNAEMKVQIDSIKSEMDSLKTAKDEAETKLSEATDKISALEAEMKETKDALDVFKQAEKEAVDAKRQALSEKMPGMKAVFDTADSESINKAFDEMEKSSAKKLDVNSKANDGENEELTDQQKMDMSMSRKKTN